MKFPNFYRAITDNESLIDSMGAALIEDGKIVLTTGNYVVHSDFGSFVSNPELANERLLDKEMLRWMANTKIKSLECTYCEIIATYKNGEKQKRSYSGHINTDSGRKAIYLYGEYKNAYFPNWQNVIPQDKFYSESTGLKRIGISPDIFSKFIECFTCESNDCLLMEFAKNNQAIRVSVKTPYEEDNRKQCGIIMPLNLNDE